MTNYQTSIPQQPLAAFVEKFWLYEGYKLPADELLNLHVSLDTIGGTIANDLRNHLREAKTAETKFHILERFLLSIADWPLIHHPAVDFALQEFQSQPCTAQRGRSIFYKTNRPSSVTMIFRDMKLSPSIIAQSQIDVL